MKNKMKERRRLLQLARKINAGEALTAEACRSLIRVPDEDALLLCAGADLLREARFGRSVHLCVICNGKSGRCSEDCSFCSQSAHADTGIDVYPLLSADEMAARGKRLEATPVNRYSIVTSGRGLPKREVRTVAAALSRLDREKISACASLGIIDRDDLLALKKAGVSRYHHNLEAAPSLFPQICTTHSFAERVRTIKRARRAGLSLCVGGIFGIGESDDQIAELGLTLRELEVDAVPVNFLVPVPGTAVARSNTLTPLRCLKIIAFLRHLLPDKEIIICGGRESNLKELHPFVFYAGASGIMTGDYLTTSGRSLADDLALLRILGLEPRA
ncbi:MAG: biotin synthase BioB [Thermodesulfobacteriota bacterium]